MQRVLQASALFFAGYVCVQFVLAVRAAMADRWPVAFEAALQMAIAACLLGLFWYLASTWKSR